VAQGTSATGRARNFVPRRGPMSASPMGWDQIDLVSWSHQVMARM
jgi:hypothetical protein